MKRSEIVFNIFAVPLDAFLLLVSGLLAFYARPKLSELVGPVIYRLTLTEFLWALFPAIFVLLLIFATLGLYNIRGVRRLGAEVSRVFLGISAGLFLVVGIFFFRPGFFPSRFIVLASWALALVLVVLGRSFLKLLQMAIYAKGKGLHRLVIVNGQGGDAKNLENFYKDRTQGFVVVREMPFENGIAGVLQKLYEQSPFDEVLQANPTVSDAQNLEILQWCQGKGLAFSFVPTLFQAQQRIVEVEQVGGVPLVRVKNTPLEGWGKVAKRIMDIVLSGLAMLILSPVYLALYIAVRVGSPGPAIYPQIRGGRGRDFWFYKFRSMYTHLSDGLGGEEADRMREELWKKNDRGGADSPFLKIKSDPRVTPVGKFIRKTKLDEIPQFWNVLRGDMSLVGPRAHMLSEVARYRDKYPRVFSIRPGIFGIAQIEQMSHPDLPFDEEMRLCVYYIENWSLWMDVKILFTSFYMIFFGKKAEEDY